MNFSLLSESELDEFLGKFRTRAAQKYIQNEPTKVGQAAKLFEYAQLKPNFDYPLPIIDLYIASQYIGPKDQKYSVQQIKNLTEDEINYLDQFLHFNASLFPLEINRERILRIFRYLGILEENIKENIEENIKENIEENIKENIKENIEENTKENIEENTKDLPLSEQHLSLLVTGPIWETLQKELSIEDLKSLLVNQKFSQHNWSISVNDPNEIISKISSLDNITLNLVDRISKIGSYGALIEAIVLFKNESLIRLCKLGVPLNFYYTYVEEILQNPEWGDLPLSSPLLTAISSGNLMAIRILVEYGVNIDGFRMIGYDIGLYSSQNPLSLAVQNYPTRPLFVPDGIIVIDPREKVLEVYRAIKTLHNPIFPKPGFGLFDKRKWGIPNFILENMPEQIQIINLLLSLGADPNGGEFCPSPMMITRELSIIKLLVEAGADINRICPNPEKSFNSALAIAIDNRNFIISRYLLNHGADPTLPGQTQDGSVLDYVRQHRYFPKIIPLLEKHGFEI